MTKIEGIKMNGNTVVIIVITKTSFAENVLIKY